MTILYQKGYMIAYNKLNLIEECPEWDTLDADQRSQVREGMAQGKEDLDSGVDSEDVELLCRIEERHDVDLAPLHSHCI